MAKNSEAKIKSNHKYDDKTYRKFQVRIPRTIEEQVNARVEEYGSINKYFVELVKKDLGIKEGKEE